MRSDDGAPALTGIGRRHGAAGRHVTTAISVGGVHATLALALGLGAALLLIDGLGGRIVSPMFDRQRLIAGTR